MKKKRPRVTLKDIAKEAGVSVGTVSNALNRPEVVTAATRDKVNAAVRALDFTPDPAATTLRTGHTRLIGLVVPDVTNPFYAEISSAVIESAASQGYSVILCESKDDPATELQQLELLSQRSADGAIVVPIGADQNRLNRLRAKGTHLVLLDRAAKPHEGCSVSIDDVYGGELAASLVLDAGASDIVFINGDLSINQCRDRHQGVKQAFDAREIGFAVLREITVDEMSAAEGRSTAARIVAEDPQHLPDAFLCANDLIATGVITALAAAGVRVPEDVAVVGYGDLIHPADSVVPLTTIDQPKRALGVAAVELLIKEIAEEEHDHRHTSTVFAPRLVIRESAL